MAGPGIRYYHFARELSKRYDVSLVVPSLPKESLGDFEVLRASDWRGRRFRSLAGRHDVVIAQTLRSWTMTALARTDVRVIYDLYDPFLIGNLGFHAGEDVSRRYLRAAFRAPTLLQEVALRTGSAFICASERQRDLWIGMLGALGRVEPESAARDPSLRDLIDVVPFGLESEPPATTRPALKGVVPGIRQSDKVLLWGGGIWNWFDPLTPIRAVHALARKRDDVKLFFLGVRHPNPGVHQTGDPRGEIFVSHAPPRLFLGGPADRGNGGRRSLRARRRSESRTDSRRGQRRRLDACHWRVARRRTRARSRQTQPGAGPGGIRLAACHRAARAARGRSTRLRRAAVIGRDDYSLRRHRAAGRSIAPRPPRRSPRCLPRAPAAPCPLDGLPCHGDDLLTVSWVQGRRHIEHTRKPAKPRRLRRCRRRRILSLHERLASG